MITRYRIYRDGRVSEERDSVSDLWPENIDDEPREDSEKKMGLELREGMVGFLLGCSFSWEQALVDAGLTPRHIEEGRNVPM